MSEDQLVVSAGFNGQARGLFDAEDLLRNVKEKLKWICHAEMNGISNVARIGVAMKGGTIFVIKFPRFECCNAIAQAGPKRIYTLDNRDWDDDEFDGIKCKDSHSGKRALLKQVGIRVDGPVHPDFNSRSLVHSSQGSALFTKGGMRLAMTNSDGGRLPEELDPAARRNPGGSLHLGTEGRSGSSLA